MTAISASFARLVPCRVLCATALFGAGLHAQVQLAAPQQSGPVLANGDLAVLETKGTRKDFHCGLKPVQPFPGFDLRLHAGYDVTIPSRELAGQAGHLRCIFRVTPEDRPDEPVYFTQPVPLDSSFKHGMPVHGRFQVGPGKYRVDWLLRDTLQRVCAFHWQLDVKGQREHEFAFGLSDGVVRAQSQDLFDPEPPVTRVKPGGLHAVVLVNLAPQKDGATLMDDGDLAALVSILRDVAREPRFATFSLTAFQLNDMRVLYRQENTSQIDFPGLGDALEARREGTVNVRQLIHKHPRRAFLASLITKTVHAPRKPDILIFVGVKAMLDGHLALDGANLPEPAYPIAYLNYNNDPQGNPWQDAIGDAVKFLKGRIYTITQPLDLWAAWRSLLQMSDARHPGQELASLHQEH